MVEQRKTKRIYAMKVIKKELVNDDEVRPRGTGHGYSTQNLRYLIEYSDFLF